MTQITASLIKQLRDATGAGMMDCKKALNESKGDFEEAKDWLRKQGIASADKKAGRVAADGLIAIAQEGNNSAVIELNSETDFVAKNDQFQALARDLAGIALTQGNDIDTINAAPYLDSGKSVSEMVTDKIGSIGEKISLRRAKIISVENGIIASYVHNAQATNLGQIGVLVALESTGDKAALETLGKQLAMHVAAAKPQSLTRDGVDEALLERERNIFSEQARSSGKPEAIIEKMVDGRIRKFYEEIVLPEQTFVMDNKSKISDVLAAAAKDLGTEVKIKDFALFILGEGIEKKEDNFAEEVAAAVGA